MNSNDRKPVAVIGGGPAGSVAALILNKLGIETIVFEKMKFPRYRLGESLLPGTISILSRLGLGDKIKAANFPKKRAATFIWGGGVPPWSFTFATPKTAPWVFDHSYQVTRAEFDKILLDTVRERGTQVNELHEVTDVELGENGTPTRVHWKSEEHKGVCDAAFVVDASGARGVLAQKMNLRQWDPYYRNMAVWAYFKGGKRFKGDLEGNIFSVTFKEGWIWIIPLKDDTYSVGVVTDISANARIRDIGAEAFYQECLQMCPLAMELLATAKQSEEVRVLREWSYEAKKLSMGHAFLCGDAGCFIDPLFSQGVHLATYSGMLAASGIAHLLEHPADAAEVHDWYERSYREAYSRYHKFVASFYASNEEPESKFWSSRKVAGAKDSRFEGKQWFTALTGQHMDAGAEGAEELESGAAALAELWQHGSSDLSDAYDETELSMRRVLGASRLQKELQSMTTMRWTGTEVRLVPSFRVHPTTFCLERQFFIGNETGRTMTAYVMTLEHQKLFSSLLEHPLSYKELAARLKTLGVQGTPLQVVARLVEQGFLQGYDKDGKPVKLHTTPRFGGVGGEDDIS